MSDHLHRKETKVSFAAGDNNMFERALPKAKTNINKSPNCVLKDRHISLKVPKVEFDFDILFSMLMHGHTRT